ncbi:MAG: YigZ family protein, partial [Flavobacteriaceae bacterium CG_4_8_14_3_um_filter_34_10]
GGTKLGVGGLISAYKTSAKETLEASEIITKTIDVTFQITFDYKNMNRVMRVIKEKQLHILEQKMALNCTIFISVRKNIAEEVQSIFESIYKVSIQSIS